MVENACQSLARDVMVANMLGIEAAGYAILLTVHDEIVTEALNTDDYNAKQLAQLMAKNPTWAEGLPLEADGFECVRYRKD